MERRPSRGDTTTMTTTALYTSGDLARLLDAKVQTVRHILQTRRHIRERHRAGITKLYGAEALELVRLELEAIERRQHDRKRGEAE